MMRIYFYHKKKLLFCLGAAGTFICACICGFFAWVQPTQANVQKILPIYNVETSQKEIALTFDVAWGDSDYEEILSILQEYSAQATFFCTGKWVEEYPEHVKTAIRNGNDIQNHSYNHPHVASIGDSELQEDTISCQEEIEKVLGYKTNLYRAPYGEYDNEMMAALEELEYTVIQWDVDSRDWQETATVEKITSGVLENTKEGSILLFHVDAKPKCTAEALRNILEQLSGDGYTFVLVKDLLIEGDYEIDHNGTMIKNNNDFYY